MPLRAELGQIAPNGWVKCRRTIRETMCPLGARYKRMSCDSVKGFNAFRYSGTEIGTKDRQRLLQPQIG